MTISWDAVNWQFIAVVGPLLFALLCLVVYFFLFAKNRKRVPGDRLLSILTILSVLGIAASLFVPAIGPWDVLAEGIYDHSAFYQTEGHTSHGGHYTVPHLVVFFQDGRVCKLDRVASIPFSKGARLRILTKNGRYKFEKF